LGNYLGSGVGKRSNVQVKNLIGIGEVGGLK